MKKHKQIESIVLVLSDLHIGKKTPKFSYRIAGLALQKIADAVKRIADLLKADGEYEFDEGYLLFLGDCVDGTEIYPDQAHHLEIHSVVQQCSAAALLCAPVIETMAKLVPKLTITGVAGNHGRAGKHAVAASNWDLVFYQCIMNQFSSYRNIKFDFPVIQTRPTEMEDFFWLKALKVRKHWFILHHGHGRIASFAGIPFYGIIRRALNWKATLPYDWKVLIHGHFHQYGHLKVNNLDVLLNGTLVQHDLWAVENFAAQEQNYFHFFGVSDKYPITWHYAINSEVKR